MTFKTIVHGPIQTTNHWLARRPFFGSQQSEGTPHTRRAMMIALIAAWSTVGVGPLSRAQSAKHGADPASPAARSSHVERFEFMEPHMGMPVRVTLYAPDQAAANAAARAAYDKIHAVEAVCTDYDDESELMRLCASSPHARPVQVSEHLFRCLARAQDFAKRSDGAFDVTVRPFVQEWNRSRRTGHLPAEEKLAGLARFVGYQHLELLPESSQVRLLRGGMQITLGGIAAGYAVDLALAELTAHGVESAMIDASGDIGVTAAPPGTQGWRIGIIPGPAEPHDPTRFIEIAQAAVTASGDLTRFVEIGGVRYSHIINPQTGLGLTDRSRVTVIAKTCIEADALATAISVLGPERGFAMLQHYPGSEAHVERIENGKTVESQTEGFSDD